MIRIKTVKDVDENGVKGRKIIFLQGLTSEELPEIYLNQPISFYFVKYNKSFFNRGIYRELLRKDKFYPEDLFQSKLDLIKKAGEVLHEIKLEIEEIKEDWNGIEEFKI